MVTWSAAIKVGHVHTFKLHTARLGPTGLHGLGRFARQQVGLRPAE